MGKLPALVTVIAAALLFAPQATAAPPPPGCERIPILGLNPQIRHICDAPIQADGSWQRFRSFSSPMLVRSSCDGVYYGSGYCWPGQVYDSVPAWQSPVDSYIVTAGTVPPGEPGYIGG